MDFCEANLLRHTSQEDAFQKLDDIGNRQIEILRKLTKKVQEARHNQDDDIVRTSIEEYDGCIER